MAQKFGPTVTRSRDGVGALVKSLQLLAKKHVLVGVPEEATDRDNDRDTDITNAEIAYISTFGSEDLNIPPRPFLEEGIKEGWDKIQKEAERTGRLALRTVRATRAGEVAGIAALADVEAGLNRMGIVAVDAIKKKITDGPFEPLSEVTIQKREERGFTGTKPLIETGQLREAINYVVEDVNGNN